MLQELATGEALVSVLDEKGVPTVVERAGILPPKSSMNAVDSNIVAAVIGQSPLFEKYGEIIDRESAYEIISAEQERAAEEKAKADEEAAKAKAEAEAEKEKAKKEKEEAAKQREKEKEAKAKATKRKNSAVGKATSSAMNSFGRELGKQIFRGIFGTYKR